MTINQSTNSQTMAELLAAHGYPVCPVRGALIEGTVLSLPHKSGYWIDCGFKSEGVCPTEEAADIELTPGSKHWFLVEHTGEEEDSVVLSARKAKAWGELKSAMDSGATVSARVQRTADNSRGGISGLHVSVSGLRGFVPFSLLGFSPTKARTLAENHETLEAKVQELDPVNNRLILNSALVRKQKEELNRESESKRDQRFDQVKLGESVTGTVVLTVDYGCFVDIGDQLNALLHNDEHSGNTLSVGDQVTGRITRRHRDTTSGKRILAISTQPPLIDRITVGEVITGSVRNVTDFGVFVRLSRSEHIDGLVHRSQMDNADELLNSLKPRTLIKVRVIEVDREKRRISLSTKNVEASAA